MVVNDTMAKIMDVIKSKEFILEALKLLMTSLLGIATFRIYEGYRNKKDNNRLYIKIIKLKKELLKNKCKIEKILNEYKKKKSLNEHFYINKVYNDELYNFYCDIAGLTIYCQEYERHDEDGELIDSECYYADKPYQEIEELKSNIDNLQSIYHYNYHKLENLKKQLSNLEDKDIYKDLSEIEKRIPAFLKTFHPKLYAPIEFLQFEIKGFNTLKKKEKEEKLQIFCNLILHEENEFTKSLEDFKTLRKLKKKLDSTTYLKLDFNLWELIDFDLLVCHDEKIYLDLEELYSGLSVKVIDISSEDSVKETHNILVNKLEPIIDKSEKKLKKNSLKTKIFFGGM